MGKFDGPRNDTKKLSWTYRNKKRQGKTRKPISDEKANVQIQNKKARIIVRNLSFKVTEEDVKNLYKPFGEIEEIDLLRRPDGKYVGCGFVQFKKIEDASKAIFRTNKQEFLGRPINVSWAIAKSKFVEQQQNTQKSEIKSEEDEQNDSSSQPIQIDDNDDKSEKPEEPDIIKLDSDPSPSKPSSERKFDRKSKKEYPKLTKEDRKLQKLHKRQKRSRIIVRNLPFKATEKDLEEHFSQYGSIAEVKLLTKSDGKRVGCGFIQFDHVQSAAKAIHYSNLKPMMDRLIVADWAVSKKKYSAENSSGEVKQEPGDDDPEIVENDTKSKDFLKNEGFDEDVKSENSDEDSSSSDEKPKISDSENSEEEDDEEEEEEEEEDEEKEIDEKPIKADPDQRRKVFSHDVTEGKTVFLKNVPFSVKNEELRACMEQFGPVYYALVCMDSLTEHSKGTAFVKFVNVEDAEKCLSSGTELQLHGQTLDPHRALDRREIQDSKDKKTQTVRKDSRNLYLVKEGVILAGSPAAADVSAADMAKRLQMEQWKSQMLKNLNMFVSRTRLVVHNLPPTLDDATLRQIFKKHGGEKSVIVEARVMRDLRNPDANGVGKSKEFGFVAFTSHEDAIRALRSVNNNPNIFSKTKRPIVAFSIENRVMVNAKERRVQKSRENNPLWKGKREREDGDQEESSPRKIRKWENSAKNNKNTKNSGINEKKDQVSHTNQKNDKKFSNDNKNGKNRKSYKNKNEGNETRGKTNKNSAERTESPDVPEFSGVTAKPGDRKMRSKFNLKSQAQLHAKVKKNEKKEKKMKRKFVERKQEEKRARKEIKPKQGAKKLNKDDANLERMVENYRSKLAAVPIKKTKWYET